MKSLRRTSGDHYSSGELKIGNFSRIRTIFAVFESSFDVRADIKNI